MKKTTSAMLPVLFALILTSALIAQPKSLARTGEAPTPEPHNQFNASVVNSRLVFPTIEDYERAVNNPTEEVRTEFLGIVSGFRSSSSYGDQLLSTAGNSSNGDPLIKDEYFAAILNADLAVQIGGYIFRINPISEKAYVLPVSQANQYDDLIAENTANGNIRVFSTDDDVLRLIQTADKGLSLIQNVGVPLFCRQTGIGSKYDEAYLTDGTGKLASAFFNRYAIYFSLSARIDPQGSWPSPYVFDFTGGIGQGYVHYHAKCGTTADYATTSNGVWRLTAQVYQSYQGSTNLNEVYFKFRVKKPSVSPLFGGGVVSRLIGFRANW
jgi:hypothetical protein